MRLPHRLSIVAALVLVAGAARAADPSTPRIGPEEGSRGKLDRVLRTLPEGEAAALRARVASGQVPARDALHRLLCERNPAYAGAVARFDRDGANAEDFAKLAAGTDASPLGVALRAHAAYFQGRAHLDRDEYEKACEAFERVRTELGDGTPWTDEASLYLGYAYARRPELEEDKERLFRNRARACLETLVPGEGPGVYPRAPERTRESARWLLRELQGEGSGPLLELARRMETVERSIERERTGKPVQKRQDQIISEIDRLIALMREKEKNGDGGGGGQGGGKKGGGKGGQNAGGPARRSALPGALQPGEINKQNRGGTSEWGDLKEKEREQVLQALKDKFPERYREIIEQYFKGIAGQAGPRPRDEAPRAPEKK